MQKVSLRSVMAIMASPVSVAALVGCRGFNPGNGNTLPAQWPAMHIVVTAKGLLMNPHVEATYEYFRPSEGHWKLVVVESKYDDEIGDYSIFDGEKQYKYRPPWMKEPHVSTINSPQRW